MHSTKNTFTILSLLFIGHFLVDFMIGIWPVYKTIAHLDLALVGLIGGFCAFAGEGFQVVFGPLSDRGHRKTMLAIGVLASAASILLAYTGHYAFILCLCLLSCLGSGAFHPSAVSLMGELSEKRKGLMISIFASGGALGLASGQLIFSQVYMHLKGDVAILLIPSAFVALLILLSRHTKSLSKPSQNTANRASFKVFGGFFRRPELRWLYISQVCNAAIMWGLIFLLPDMLKDRHYEPWIVYGTGHFTLILGGAVMMIPAGYISDKFSSRSIIFVATLLGLALFYALLLIPSASNMALLALLFFTGASLGVVNPVSVALGTSLAPNHKASIGAFLMGMVWCVSEFIGQCGGGILTSFFVEEAPAKALELLGLLFIIGLTAVARLPVDSQQLEYA